MKKYSFQEWLGKLALPGILIGMFTVVAFTPEINSLGTGIISRGEVFSTIKSQCVQPVFSTAVECVNLAEPVNGNISKAPSSFTNVIPVSYISSAFHMNNQYSGKYIYFSDKVPSKSYRQICLLVDLPPPALC
jgi:hypothetical protein